jgi:ABC-type bacteriocin/lantibiotic exporter with double-glycine peptidase domain
MILVVAAAAAWLAAAPRADSASGEPAIHLDVPVVRQAPERCGPAALAMVLRFYDAPSTALAEADRAYDRALRGALITDLRDAARRAGFSASIETPGEEGLLALLRDGIPPILLYQSGVGPVSRGHYGVVTGWDPARARYVLNDGGARSRLVSSADLLRRWQAAGGRALVIEPQAK